MLLAAAAGCASSPPTPPPLPAQTAAHPAALSAAPSASAPDAAAPPVLDLRIVARGDDIVLHRLANTVLVSSGRALYEVKDNGLLRARDWAAGLPAMQPKPEQMVGYLVPRTFLFAGIWPEDVWLAAMEAQETGAARVYHRAGGRWALTRKTSDGALSYVGAWGDSGMLGYFEGLNGQHPAFFVLSGKPDGAPIAPAAPGFHARGLASNDDLVTLSERRVVSLRTGDVFMTGEDGPSGSVLLHWSPGAPTPTVERLPCFDGVPECALRGLQLAAGLGHHVFAMAEFTAHAGRVEPFAAHVYLGEWDGQRWTPLPRPPTGLSPVGMAQGPDGTLWLITDGRSRYHCDRALRGEVWEKRRGSEWRPLRFADAVPRFGAQTGPTEPVQIAADGTGRPWIVVQTKASCTSEDGRIALMSTVAGEQVLELE